MKSESYFLSDEAWALRKHALASAYLQNFQMKNCSSKEFFCVDTFNSSVSVDAHKHRALERGVRSFSSGSKAVGVKLIKVSTKPTTTYDESDAVGLPAGAVATMEGKREQIFPRILSIVGNKPAMFFIDPSGRPVLPFNALKSILRRKQEHTEIIIKFDAEAIWRQALESCLSECGHTNACTTLLRTLARILGVEKLQHLPVAGPVASLVSNYALQLRSYGFTVVAHCIKDAIGLPSNLYLIYCTRDPRNVVVVNDALRTTEDRLVREFLEREGVERLEDALAADVFLRTQELRHLMIDLEKGSEGAKLTDKQWRILCERFGEFHQNDFAIEVSEGPETDDE